MTKIIVLVLLCGLITLNAVEHHDHKKHKHGPRQEGDSQVAIAVEDSKASIEKNAKQKIERLVIKNKIHNSWVSVPILKMEKTKNTTNDWVVSFYNPKIKKKSKQMLYVFVSAYGEVVGVNYTGK
jgi:hypothetical protein